MNRPGVYICVKKTILIVDYDFYSESNDNFLSDCVNLFCVLLKFVPSL